MFKFDFGGTTIECDDATEVRALLNGSAPASTNGHATTEHRPTKARAKARATGRGKPQVTEALWDEWKDKLPKVRGTLGGFAATRKVAKKIGYEGDIRALRSMLKRKLQES